MGVSRSSLYYQSTLKAKDEALKQAILRTWDIHPAYGHRRLAIHLQCNKKRVQRVMKLFTLEVPIKRRKSADGAKGLVVMYQNWLQTLCPIQANVCWASDFTYLWYQGQWLYLATIIDVYTRELIGVAFSQYHTQELVIEALQDALHQRPAPQYLHSDQGSEYCAEKYVRFVHSLGITMSYSSKGRPWHNGCQESFYSQFKLELGPIRRFGTRSLLLEAIYLHIYYYNNHRIHLALQMSPVSFARKHSLRLSSSERVS
jgi:transposase InsO family protein